MNTFPLDVIEYCSHLAENRLFVQGKGGNVSIKVLDKMLIKASGVSMGSLSSPDTCVAVRYIDLLNDLEHKGNSIDITDYYDGPVRPSIETSFHAVIPSKVVLHLHCVICFTEACLKTSNATEKYSLTGFSFDWIDYVHPGVDLAIQIQNRLKVNPTINGLFLQNHGVIVFGESITEVAELYEKLVKSFIETASDDFRISSHTDCASLEDQSNLTYRWVDNAELHDLAVCPEYMLFMSKYWAICPDHVLFLGDLPTMISTEELTTISFHQNAPFIFVKNVGVLAHSNTTDAHVEQLLFYLDVTRRCWNVDVSCLDESQVSYIRNWEAEKYRLNLVMDRNG